MVPEWRTLQDSRCWKDFLFFISLLCSCICGVPSCLVLVHLVIPATYNSLVLQTAWMQSPFMSLPFCGRWFYKIPPFWSNVRNNYKLYKMFRMATMLQKKSLIWYFHGCCSIFSQANARHTFLLQLHETIFVTPPQQNGKGQWKDQRREEGKYQANFELPSGAQGFFAFGWPLRNSASNSWVGARDTAQHYTGFIASFRNKKMGNKKELPSERNFHESA